MIRVLVIQGKDVHTNRLVSGLSMAGCNVTVVKAYNKIPDWRADLTFVDPSAGFDPTLRLNSIKTVFYDCEDSPLEYTLGPAFHALKHKIEYYVKMNWVGETFHGMKLIGFPIAPLLDLAYVANLDLTPYKSNKFKPFFVGSGTFIGNYHSFCPLNYEEDSDSEITSMGKYYNDNTKEEELIYNQRIDWLLSLIRHKISYVGGIVFHPNDNLSLKWQQNIFGKGVSKLGTNPIDKNSFFHNLFQCKVGLNPTGHDRLSWRIFDLMAAGSIIISTDLKNQKSMYMPKEIITIKDNEDLGTKLLEIENNYQDIWNTSQKNREIFSNLTSEKLWSDFKDQF